MAIDMIDPRGRNEVVRIVGAIFSCELDGPIFHVVDDADFGAARCDDIHLFSDIRGDALLGLRMAKARLILHPVAGFLGPFDDLMTDVLGGVSGGLPGIREFFFDPFRHVGSPGWGHPF